MEMRAVYNKIFILMLILPLLVSCAAKDVTESSITANIVDKCFQATKDLVIYEVQGSDKIKIALYSSSYLMIGDPSESQRFVKNGKAIDSIQMGEKLLITKVIDYPYGSAGHCWVVKGRYERLEGELLEIPSCWVWDDPIWIEPMSPIDQRNTGEYLRIKAPQLKEVPRFNCSAND